MKSGEDKRCGKGDNNPTTTAHATHSDVTLMAVGVMALLRNDKKKAHQRVKQLIKLNKEMACAVFTSEVDGWTPIHACALRGPKKLLKAMLQAGVSVNCTMGQPEGLPGGCTLLHVAANRTDKKVLDYLLHHGADLHSRDSEGNTALFYAKQSNKDSARLLLNYGASVSDSHSDSDQHDQHQTQHVHICVGATTLKRHGSSSSLKQERLSQRKSEDTFHTTQQNKLHTQNHWHQEHSERHSSITASSIVSATETALPAKSNFLTVPPVKFYSSSPCLHIQGTAASSSVKSLTSSNSSSNIMAAVRSKISSRTSKTAGNNNNNTTITDLNTKKGGKTGSRSGYASSESLINKPSFQIVQNNSD